MEGFSPRRPRPEEIVLAGEGSSCDFFFEVGARYLVYAVRAGGKLTTLGCAGNTKLENAAVQLGILGKGRKPQKIKSPRIPAPE